MYTSLTEFNCLPFCIIRYHTDGRYILINPPMASVMEETDQLIVLDRTPSEQEDIQLI